MPRRTSRPPGSATTTTLCLRQPSRQPITRSGTRSRRCGAPGPLGGFAPFKPQPPDAANLASPPSGSGGVATSTSLVWNTCGVCDLVRRVSRHVDLEPGVGGQRSRAARQQSTDHVFMDATVWLSSRRDHVLLGGDLENVCHRREQLHMPAAVSSVWAFSTAASGGGGGPLPAPWSSQDVGARRHARERVVLERHLHGSGCWCEYLGRR